MKSPKAYLVLAVILLVLFVSMIHKSDTREPQSQTEAAITNEPTDIPEPTTAPTDIPKPTESKNIEADVKIATDIPGIDITTHEKDTLRDCKIVLNDDYRRSINGELHPEESLNTPFRLFTKNDGTRFNLITTAPKNVLLTCGEKWGYWEFSR